MSSSFQPDQPYAPSRETRGRASLFWPAAISGLLTMMLVAFGLPATVAFEESSWWITLGAGVLVFAAILGISAIRHTREAPPKKQPPAAG